MSDSWSSFVACVFPFPNPGQVDQVSVVAVASSYSLVVSTRPRSDDERGV